MRTGAFILLLASAAPAYAQDHAAHQPHEVQAAAPDKAPPQSAHPEQESEIQAATALPPMDLSGAVDGEYIPSYYIASKTERTWSFDDGHGGR